MVFKNVTMKKFILFCSLLFVTKGVFAQGNLQFNQVLTYNGAIGTYLGLSSLSATYTVPTGKVWKIETKSITSSSLTFLINGRTFRDVEVRYSGFGSGTMVFYSISNPIWLKAGDYINFNSTAYVDDYFISIIEYNIVP